MYATEEAVFLQKHTRVFSSLATRYLEKVPDIDIQVIFWQ